MTRPLFLASRSPRRRELLSEAGIPFGLVDVEVDESEDPALEPSAFARTLAERKARCGAASVREGLVLGADTVVALGERVFGKPTDRPHARRMLRELSGQTHRVITGVCLLDANSGQCWVDSETTFVTMRSMSDAEIAQYVDSGESDDKAGAYAIQETGDRFVSNRQGSYTNVVGLPMELVMRLLGEARP